MHETLNIAESEARGRVRTATACLPGEPHPGATVEPGLPEGRRLGGSPSAHESSPSLDGPTVTVRSSPMPWIEEMITSPGAR